LVSSGLCCASSILPHDSTISPQIPNSLLGSFKKYHIVGKWLKAPLAGTRHLPKNSSWNTVSWKKPEPHGRKALPQSERKKTQARWIDPIKTRFRLLSDKHSWKQLREALKNK
jgi:hypothetical protein